MGRFASPYLPKVSKYIELLWLSFWFCIYNPVHFVVCMLQCAELNKQNNSLLKSMALNCFHSQHMLEIR